MDSETLKHYLADDPPTVVTLPIAPHFHALTAEEKRYAHYLSLAAYSGSRIVLRQVTPESEPLYEFIIALYHHCNGDWQSLQKQAGVTQDDLKHFLNFSAQFLGNLGNFKSFGDSKFVPRVPKESLSKLASNSDKTKALFATIQDAIHENDLGHMHLGYIDQGHVTTYYPDSPSITKDEINYLSDFLSKKGLLPENTRVQKSSSGDFDVLVASAQANPAEEDQDVKQTAFQLTGPLEGKTANIVFGDHTKEMAKIVSAMEEAGKHTSRELQKRMISDYEASFSTGSGNRFKDSQRFWVQDKAPPIESNIGFIETYRDPHGIRGEWEGLVATVNKERTRAFSKLVDASPTLIPRLPWDEEFEKDQFLSPDFTSLEVLTFAGSGIPSGINIPNFDDIRQNEGFKNVSLGNAISAASPTEPIPLLHPDDLTLYRQTRDAAFEVQVGLHELTGHGCGKLLQETSPGIYNFPHDNPPINPLTNKPVSTWYKPDETWSSVFQSTAPSYEECRAELVAMALGCNFDVLNIFGHEGDNLDSRAGDILWATYLSMARAGLVALEFWDPSSGKWGQAHMQARFSILKTFLEAGGGLCTLEYKGGEDDEPVSDLTVRIDRTKIHSHGLLAVRQYLLELHIHKSIADVANGTKFYSEKTRVDKWWAEAVRPEIMRRKVPRKVFVQANTFIDAEGNVELKEYEPSPEGMIKSWAEREYV